MSITKNKLSGAIKAHDKDIINPDEPIIKNTKACVSLIIGRKRSGKSSLYLSMLNHPAIYRGYYHNIFMICPSKSDDKMSDLMKELEKDGKLFDAVNDANINTIISIIRGEQAQKKAKEKKTGKKLPELRNLIIMDDVVSDLPRSHKKNPITNLFYNCRHLNASIICISQSYKNIHPNLRKQADQLFIFPMANKKEVEALQDDWDIPNEIFDYAFEDESDHPFLLVNVCGNKNRFFRKFDKINI